MGDKTKEALEELMRLEPDFTWPERYYWRVKELVSQALEAQRVPEGVGITSIRRAVADYISSEGCHCCEGSDHGEHYAELGRLLGAPQYDDGSGYDFSQFQTDAAKEDE
jgi:hypothetical protein